MQMAEHSSPESEISPKKKKSSHIGAARYKSKFKPEWTKKYPVKVGFFN